MDNATCPGFLAGGIASGIKKNGEKDIGLIFSQKPASVAGVFTKNRVQAAPVLLDRQRVQSGICQAVIVNSGNANCCTGKQGMRDAEAMAGMAAAQLGIPAEQVLVSSTGVIGQPLPLDKIESAVPDLVQAASHEGFADLARAIMTTDTVPKVVVRTESVKGKSFSLIAIAKGSGMIRPDMATMLCFVCTDVHAKPEVLKNMLNGATEQSFNRITIDGDMSTNDTVLMLANGISGVNVETGRERQIFQELLDDTLKNLARQLVKDGEGVTKLVEVVVKGAVSTADAQKVADTVANSNLVKTAFFGEDANWGRILGAAGRAGVPIEPDSIDLYFDAVQMVRDGMGCGRTQEAEATTVLKKPEFTVTVDLKMGRGTASVITCDFSVAYVEINADYRS